MKNEKGKRHFSRKVILYEEFSFASIILLIWLDEFLDIPYHFLGGEATPINWRESLFESIAILLLRIVVVHITRNVFLQMKYLEGILPVCASCKKIRDDKKCWHQIEEYIQERSAVDFSHGICPDCARKLYPELFQGTDTKM